MTDTHSYSSEFYDYLEAGSSRSAQVVVPILMRLFSPKSVLDVGCGRGTWLTVFRENGVGDILGLDGSHVSPSSLYIAPASFRSQDLSRPFSLERSFSLALSLEVAEHIPRDSAATFVDNLTRHADLVVFSAAVPGQGGEHHVNEQSYEYWRDLFATAGFAMSDCLRGLLAGDRRVEPWYRYNTFVFIRESRLGDMSDTVRYRAIRRGERIARTYPASWAIRLAILRRLPPGLVSRLSILYHKAMLACGAYCPPPPDHHA